MKIALDAMGGDFAPHAILEGALLGAEKVGHETTIVLVGQEEVMRAFFDKAGHLPKNIELVHAPEVIGMSEHPTKALPQKPKSSISVGFGLLKNKEVDAFCGAGNTGAMHVAALFSVQAIKGVSRPAIISYVPKLDGRMGIILDVGANTDCKPEHLQQFAQIGSIFCQHVFNIDKPKVALINLGEEPGKGNITTQAAYKLLSTNSKINFVGNIEGRDLYNEKADVIVCDGFIGNIVIKMAESYFEILKKRNYEDEFFENFNYESIGGSPILGINGNVIIGHGISNALTIQNMLLMAERMVKADIHTKIRESINVD